MKASIAVGGGGSVDAYISAVSGPDAVRKGQRGRLKMKSSQKRSRGDEMDLDEDESKAAGKKLGHGRTASGGSIGSARGGKTKPQNARRGLGVEKGRGAPQKQKFRGGQGVGKRGVRFAGNQRRR